MNIEIYQAKTKPERLTSENSYIDPEKWILNYHNEFSHCNLKSKEIAEQIVDYYDKINVLARTT